MDEYISRRELLARYDAEHEGTPGRARELIKQAPAADVAPVIRCEECRYYQNAKINNKGFLICPASGMEITEDDYCSYGERKEDDT